VAPGRGVALRLLLFTRRRGKIDFAELAHHRAGEVAVKTVEVIDMEGGQVIKLPAEFRFCGSSVSIRKSGDAVILEPVKPEAWPPGFFEAIKIEDPAFARPDQGRTPPAPTWD
jgi:virulence-associated protein VagC